METNFTIFLDLIGTFVFAASGIQWAVRKQIDWFGAYAIGLVTTIGGQACDLVLGTSNTHQEPLAEILLTNSKFKMLQTSPSAFTTFWAKNSIRPTSDQTMKPSTFMIYQTKF